MNDTASPPLAPVAASSVLVVDDTADNRRLIAGTGFTIEPGIYIPGEFGMRTEIDVFVAPEGPVATTEIQRDLVRVV